MDKCAICGESGHHKHDGIVLCGKHYDGWMMHLKNTKNDADSDIDIHVWIVSQKRNRSAYLRLCQDLIKDIDRMARWHGITRRELIADLAAQDV